MRLEDADDSVLIAADGTDDSAAGTKRRPSYQASTTRSPATMLSQWAAEASPATTARWPLLSTRSPNSDRSRSAKAATQRRVMPWGTSAGGSVLRLLASSSSE